MMKNKIVLAAAAVVGVVALTSGGAVAGALITSADIKDNTVQSRDLKDGKGVGEADLKPGLAAKVNAVGSGEQGPAGPKGDTGAQGPAGPAGAQGPKGDAGERGPKGDAGADGADGADGQDGADGTSNPSAAGAGYDTTWAANSYGETVETCAPGEYVTGGGYSTWGGFNGDNSKDLGGGNLDIQVTVAAPYVSSDAAYVPISDADSRFYADRFVVRGFNHGDTDQIVRAWALCAPLPN